jgi:hypothetical protein
MRKLLAAGTVVLVLGGAAGTTIAVAEDSGRPRCTPGYRPCIPNRRTDVDCAGGGGDGPRFTRPGVEYRVTGSDRYRLDGDNDGIGCER